MNTYLHRAFLNLSLLAAVGLGLLVSLDSGAITLTGVTQDEATAVAKNWAQSCVTRYGDWGGVDTPVVGKVTPLFAAGGRGRLLAYVVAMQPSGFVLVPGVRELPPIKAYSATDAFVAGGTFETNLVASLTTTLTNLAVVTADRAGTVSTSANLQSWGSFLAAPTTTRADSYTGIAGVKFSMRAPILDSASYSGGYAQPLVWAAGTPYRNKCPQVKTTPEDIWFGVVPYDSTTCAKFDRYKAWSTDKKTAASQVGLYYTNIPATIAFLGGVPGSTYRYFPDPADATNKTVLNSDVVLVGDPIWKDEDGDGKYTYGIDTPVYPPASITPVGWMGWQAFGLAYGALPGQQTGMYYYDFDSSDDYTYTSGYTHPGSLAVGMAELMRYWEWPNMGVGTHSYAWTYKDASLVINPNPTTNQAITLTTNFAHPYTWNRMPLNSLWSATQAEQDNVSQLIYDVATCFNADFQRKTVAVDFSQDSLTRIADHFLYNHRAMEFVGRKNFAGDDLWFARLQEELDAHRPVLLRSFLADGTFVAPILDGYDKAAGSANLYLMHCNFYGGRYWYALDNIGGIPQLLGTDSTVLQPGDILAQDAIVNVLPQRTKPVLLVESFSKTGDASGITMAGALQGLVNSYKSAYYFDDVNGLGGTKGVRYTWTDGAGGNPGVYDAGVDVKVSPNAANPGWAGINGVSGLALAAKVAVLSYRPDAGDVNAPVTGSAAATLTTEQMTQYSIASPVSPSTVVVVNGQSATKITGSGVALTDLLNLRAEALRRSSTMSKFLITGDSVLGNTPLETKPVFQADVYVSRLDEDVPDSVSLTLKLVLAENKNANDVWIVRDLLAREDIKLGYGETHVVHVPSFQLPPDPSWNLANCRVIAFLEQADGTIAQAGILAKFAPGPNYLLDPEQAKYTGQLVNNPPFAPASVTLVQETDGSKITAITTGAYDPDGDAISYLYTWILNGVPVLVDSASDTISTPAVAPYFSTAGDVWTCEVRVQDEYYVAAPGTAAGKWKLSHESATVVSNDLLYLQGYAPPVPQGNLPPSAPSLVVLDPATPAAGQPITCLASGSVDPDGDAVSYLYAWYNDVIGLTAYTAAVLPYGVTSTGETWYCEVTARDPWGDSSGVVDSAPVTITDPLAGAPSAPLIVSIGPVTPSYTATLTCGVPLGISCPTDVISPVRWAAADYTVSYRWWQRIDNVWMPTPCFDQLSTPHTWQRVGGVWTALPGSVSTSGIILEPQDIGTVWRCQVYGTNSVTGAVGPSVYSNEVLVRNYAPSDPQVSLAGSNVPRNQDLICALQWSIDKEDGELNSISDYYFEWYLNGHPSGIYGLGQNTVAKDKLTASQKWLCRVWAVDSLGARSAMVKTSETMVGTPPTAPTGVSLSPQRPEIGDTVTCLHDTSTSPDGNTVSYEYAWYKYTQLPFGTVQPSMPDGFVGNDNIKPEAGYYWADAGIQQVVLGGAADNERWICRVRATDGVLTSAWAGSSYAVLIGNQPPTSPTVTVTPVDAKAGQGMTCSATGSTDPNGGSSAIIKLYGVDDNPNLTYSYQWEYKRGGATVWALGPTTPILAAAVTQVGDIWRCAVVVKDNYTANPRETSPTYSQEMSFVLTAPTPPTSVTITPTFPKTGQSLTCSASGGTDKSGDPVSYIFTWSRTRVPAAPYSATSTDIAVSTPIPGTEVVNGDVWTCSVVSTNGTLTSAPPILVSVTVANLPPSAPSTVVVTPNPAGTMADLVCTAGGAVDPNGDAVTYSYQWKLNGSDPIPNGLAYQSYRLAAARLHIGDLWSCSVFATDNDIVPLSGPAKESNPVRIQNLPPTAPVTVTIIPASPTVVDDLVCNAADASDPEGGSVSYEYRWFRNGLSVGFATDPLTQKVLAGMPAIGESWRCEARAKDNATPANYSAWVSSAAVTIGTATPSDPVVTVTPVDASKMDDLICSATGSVDPLGGTVTYVYAWYKNGALVTAAASAVLPHAGLANLDVVTCAVFTVNSRGFHSNTITSNEVRITNHAPTVPTVVTITPTVPTINWATNGNITMTCNASGATDRDGDPITYVYRWQNDSVTPGVFADAVGITTQIVPPPLADGVSWRCYVSVTDGTLTSTEVMSNVVRVTGSAPTAPTVDPLVRVTAANAATYTPLGYKIGDLVCTAYGSTDADVGDTLTYVFTWFRNGAEAGIVGVGQLAAGKWTNGIGGVFTEESEVWFCRVTVYDSRGAVSAATDSAPPTTVQNTIPSFAPGQTAVISPLAPTVNNSLICTVSGTPVDPDGPVAYVFSWFKNGVLQSQYTSATVPAATAAFTTGDVWYCQVTARDSYGALSTDTITSNTVAIVSTNGGDSYETDNDPSLATLVFPNGRSDGNATSSGGTNNPYQIHSISSSVDVDWMKFTLDRLTEIHVAVVLQVPGSASLEMGLYAAADTVNPVAQVTSADITRVLQPGDYYVKVRNTGAYSTPIYYGMNFIFTDALALGGTVSTINTTPLHLLLKPAVVQLPSSSGTRTVDPVRWAYFNMTAPATVTLSAVIKNGTGSVGMSIYDANYAVKSVVTPTTLTLLPAGLYFVRVQGSGIPVGGTLAVDLTLTGVALEANQNPLAPTVVKLFPTQPVAGTPLHCVAYGAEKLNADGTPSADPLTYWYYWYQNGIYRPELSGKKTATDDSKTFVDGAYVGDGDVWRCDVVVRDSLNAAAPLTSSNAVTVGSVADWTLAISATGVPDVTLTIGQAKLATNGWDEGIDDTMPGGGPADGSIYLKLVDSLHPLLTTLSKDIRPFKGASLRWSVEVVNSTATALTWVSASLPTGTRMIIEETDGLGVSIAGTQVDMMTTGTLALAGAGNTTQHFRITAVTGGATYEKINLMAGWSLISFMLHGVDDSVQNVFAGVNSGSVWTYSATGGYYRSASVISTKTGYWVFAPTAVTIEHVGMPDLSGETTLAKGWNLVGPTRTCLVPVSTAILHGAVYGFIGGVYSPAVLLQANYGYWIYATEAVTVDLK